MNQPASTRLSTARRTLASASAPRGQEPRDAGTGFVAAARSRGRMPLPAVAPALTTCVRERL
jgi:hypothetical protein